MNDMIVFCVVLRDLNILKRKVVDYTIDSYNVCLDIQSVINSAPVFCLSFYFNCIKLNILGLYQYLSAPGIYHDYFNMVQCFGRIPDRYWRAAIMLVCV